MSGFQEKLNKGLASAEGIDPSNFRHMRGYLYCHLTQRRRHIDRVQPAHAAHGTEKSKLLQLSVPVNSPGCDGVQMREEMRI